MVEQGFDEVLFCGLGVGLFYVCQDVGVVGEVMVDVGLGFFVFDVDLFGQVEGVYVVD